MSFPTKVIPLSQACKNWLSQTYALKNHSHPEYLKANDITGLFDPSTSMPDFTRMEFMETPDAQWATNPGTIYKINVPGYLWVESTYYGYYDEVDFWYFVASHPGYLVRHQGNSSNFGSYARPHYANMRCKLYGTVDGELYTNAAFPILPGTSTYLRLCNATTPDSDLYYKLMFVPMKGLSTSIPKASYFTRVARGENQISANLNIGGLGSLLSLGSSIFGGKWTDNFNGTTLKETNILRPKITYLTSGNWSNGHRLHMIDPVATGNNRMWYLNGGNYIMCKIGGVWRICLYSDLSIYYWSDPRGSDQIDPPDGIPWVVNTERLNSTYNLTTNFVQPTASANVAY